ncbi:hypothetical protein VAR608DRAFT_3110 [Variovorax sp. HW608]|uniref:hypothetical protein n=1 Tax=Variovorax sp. HW608 TaxID=1034889 RepID=UPI00081F9EB7|nr:hypothetical protein [Variovorax sp. HW608]SCK34729.1 hypothetical protein VAR608DRAFT_3110 [Variovorax sp. HW608]
MDPLRRARRLVSFVLMWFALSLCAAIASPVVHPQAMELLCSGTGAVKVVVHTDDGIQEMGASHFDCALCMVAGAPPPSPVISLPSTQPLSHAVRSMPAARLAAATAAPLPARGPPSLL